MRPMDEKPFLPFYDPNFCGRVVRLAAVVCLAWLAIEIGILTFIDPAEGKCPGWTIHAENGQATSLWLIVALFTAAPGLWICFGALRWDFFSQKIYDQAAGTHETFTVLPKAFHDAYKPDLLIFPYNQVFVVTMALWCLFCTAPLWIMLSECTSPLHGLVY
jgi:hypothetical protein